MCVFQQQQKVSYPLTLACPSSARCHTGSCGAREVLSTDGLELIGTCEKSHRVKEGNSQALQPAARPMSPQHRQRNVGKREGAAHLCLTLVLTKSDT